MKNNNYEIRTQLDTIGYVSAKKKCNWIEIVYNDKKIIFDTDEKGLLKTVKFTDNYVLLAEMSINYLFELIKETQCENTEA